MLRPHYFYFEVFSIEKGKNWYWNRSFDQHKNVLKYLVKKLNVLQQSNGILGHLSMLSARVNFCFLRVSLLLFFFFFSSFILPWVPARKRSALLNFFWMTTWPSTTCSHYFYTDLILLFDILLLFYLLGPKIEGHCRSEIWSPVPEMWYQGLENLVTNLTTPAP